jgi:enoyl-CoA hydratase/carnithine racemase
MKVSHVSTSFNPKTGVQTITIDKVQNFMGGNNFNTLDSQTLLDLKRAVEEANQQPDKIKAIVLETNGGKVFSGGADLDELKNLKDAKDFDRAVQLGRYVMDTIANSKIKTIAKVQGDAYGGGVELALACDEIVACDKATFTLPEVNLGIFPAWGGTERLAQKAGKPLAYAMILNGKQRIGDLDKYFNEFPPNFKWLANGSKKLINNVLGWQLNTPGYRLDAETARRVGLVTTLKIQQPDGTVKEGLPTRQELDDAFEKLLEQPEFLQKDPVHNDSMRGFSRFPSAKSYPSDMRTQFQLDDAARVFSQEVGHRFSREAAQVAKRLIDNSDTPDAGQCTLDELGTMLKNARRRNNAILGLVDSATAGYNRQQFASLYHLLKAMAVDGVKKLVTFS